MPRKYKTKDGEPIIGTVEVMAGCGFISGITDEGEPVFTGQVEWWDKESETSTGEDGKIRFITAKSADDGRAYIFEELIPDEEGNEIQT
jgi:hypothetical protein